MRISDWSSDVCSSDLGQGRRPICRHRPAGRASQRGCRPGVFGGREVLTTPSRGREGKYYCGVVTVASWPGPSGTARMVWVVVPLSTTSVSGDPTTERRSEEHTSELQSLMRISYAVCCLKKKNTIPR